MFPWPPAELSGLTVQFGLWDSERSRWARKPFAAYRCVCGFRRTAEGARDVALFCASVPDNHRAACRHHTTARSAA
ncbi:hypothetical protein [Streptomyces sp. 1222.5]|uniref:hypothetical protein n=1 Tax=Streptomyces sp. 1222.5 TaxID=1881026 RepID=UPI003EB9FA0F